MVPDNGKGLDGPSIVSSKGKDGTNDIALDRPSQPQKFSFCQR